MDFTDSLVIQHGPRAGLPRNPCDHIQDQITKLRRAVAQLKCNGFEVLDARCNISLTPRIVVRPCWLATHMLAIDQAVYYKYDGGQRWAVFYCYGCRVTWKERRADRGPGCERDSSCRCGVCA